MSKKIITIDLLETPDNPLVFTLEQAKEIVDNPTQIAEMVAQYNITPERGAKIKKSVETAILQLENV